MKRFLLMLIEFILFCGLVYLCWINYQAKTITGVSFGIEGYTNMVYPTYIVIICAYFIGILSAVVSTSKTMENYKDIIRSYSKKTNELSMQNENDSDEKLALQRKITSLEIALEKALKDNE